MLSHHLLLNSLNQPMYFNPLFQVENVTNNPQNEMSNFIYILKLWLKTSLYSIVWRAVQVTQICVCVCVRVYSSLWALDIVCLHVILGVLFSFLSSRLAAMQLWRRKSMQWVEAPMESSLNLLSVMILGLSSGQQSVLWKREGG